ncbi:SWIB domain-containing protein [Encephalitozoon hellem ATCC 50504]|uniref:SWIB domain-containing protein n=1 Tax=Encephalitozoon hellem TaxID=27973 RepID=A0A9Q9CBQ7_ENCHE|nr:SWIB domain-containing protein [Encephalitozoon hellem ATCC 50504]AFM98163.1 SWIB domain-containing protein [Encephalitozoon hellem ATCC 50504]UTX43009.1 SWIB domain-containing protein [Encephalitozoon hellem]WEL38466.1 SWIB domain-containing protein [Encephalitozoon hellem]|eukprot:XP_003887144.1 SWIB domain-containing protein [Encephalitozoon hellem ATCC 50504]
MTTLYDRLQSIEEEIDRLCLERKLNMEAEYLKRIKCKKSLRCYVKVSIKKGTFIRLDSRVINDYKNGGELKFSDVVKKFCIIFDSNLTPTVETHFGACKASDEHGESVEAPEMSNGDGSLPKSICNGGMSMEGFFEWTKCRGDTEAFEVNSSKTPKNIKLLFDLENPREIFKLSTQLSNLLMKYTDTKPNVITHLWRYVNRNGLMSIDSDVVECDPQLKDILGVERFTFPEIPNLIVPHLWPLDYLVVDVPPIDGYTEIFDIPFEWDDLYQCPALYSKRVHALDRKVESLKQLLKRCEERESILDEFGKDPTAFINKWICIDMSDICHRTSLFRNKDVQEKVFELLKKLE